MLFKRSEPKDLDKAIDRIFKEMSTVDPTSEQYKLLVDRLGELHTIDRTKKSVGVTPDAALAVAGNLIGILAIVNYERLGVITSKALPFVLKTHS